MTVAYSVVNSIVCLEELVQTKWITRVLFICSDDSQCHNASRILTSLDYVVETIVLSDIEAADDEDADDEGFFHNSIERLRKGLSKVLVTTIDALKIIQQDSSTALQFDVVL